MEDLFGKGAVLWLAAGTEGELKDEKDKLFPSRNLHFCMKDGHVDH